MSLNDLITHSCFPAAAVLCILPGHDSHQGGDHYDNGIAPLVLQWLIQRHWQASIAEVLPKLVGRTAKTSLPSTRAIATSSCVQVP